MNKENLTPNKGDPKSVMPAVTKRKLQSDICEIFMKLVREGEVNQVKAILLTEDFGSRVDHKVDILEMVKCLVPINHRQKKQST